MFGASRINKLRRAWDDVPIGHHTDWSRRPHRGAADRTPTDEPAVALRPLTAGTASSALPRAGRLPSPLDGPTGRLLGCRTPRRCLLRRRTAANCLLGCGPTSRLLGCRTPRRLLGCGPTGRLLGRRTPHSLAGSRALDCLARCGTALDCLPGCGLPRGRSPCRRLLCRCLSGCLSSHPSSRYYHRHHPHLVLDYMTEQVNGSETCVCRGGCFRVACQSVMSRRTSAWVDDHRVAPFVSRLPEF